MEDEERRRDGQLGGEGTVHDAWCMVHRVYGVDKYFCTLFAVSLRFDPILCSLAKSRLGGCIYLPCTFPETCVKCVGYGCDYGYGNGDGCG